MAKDYDDLWLACDEVVKQLDHDSMLSAVDNTAAERFKLAKRMKLYFKNALKDFNFNQDFEACVNEYCDCGIGALFCGLGDRQWLEHADFLMVLHFAVKDNFPSSLCRGIDEEQFEEVILHAYERSIDEHRWLHGRWGLVKETVSGKASQKKLQEAIDEARKQAVQTYLSDHCTGTFLKHEQHLHDFLQRWITETIKQLNTLCQGDPDSTLSKDQGTELFSRAVNSAGIPVFMRVGNNLPFASVVKGMVNEAYANFGRDSPFTRQRDGDWALQYNNKPQRGKGKGKAKRNRPRANSRSRTPEVGRARTGDSPTPPRRSPGRSDSSGDERPTPPRESIKREAPSPPPPRVSFMRNQSFRSGYGAGYGVAAMKVEPEIHDMPRQLEYPNYWASGHP